MRFMCLQVRDTLISNIQLFQVGSLDKYVGYVEWYTGVLFKV